MKLLKHEWRLLMRSRLQLGILLLLMSLSGISVWSGLQEISQQQSLIQRMQPLQDQEVNTLAQQFDKPGDPGSAAYYTFYNTWDSPSNSAFFALGLRDAAPYVLRIRALGLQAQLYEGETFNPELALPGRFDFAFVLIYLAPLFVIAMLHDLIASERQAGRLRILSALPKHLSGLWLRRAALRLGLIYSALVLPLVLGLGISASPILISISVLLTTAAYLLIWGTLAMVINCSGFNSAANATALVGAWAVLTLVLPALFSMLLTQAVPVPQGAELMRAQRQKVHGAWEVPRNDTMKAFYANHPEWADSAPMTKKFHYKWYLAFHQLGDESVADQAAAYRQGLLTRQRWTERLGWVLPSVNAQTVLHRLAATDLPAQLAYQDRIAKFHQQIREFYYPYLFRERLFTQADFALRPVFQSQPASRQGAEGLLLGLGLLAVLMSTLAVWSVSKVH